jgi:hypothetical protein
MNLLVAILIYPGALATLLLAVLLSVAAGGRLPRAGALGGALRSAEGIGGLASIGLACVAAGLLGTPLGSMVASSLVSVWVLIEAAVLAALLPAVVSRAPLAVRAASREAQMGVAGRAVLWMAAGAGGVAQQSPSELPGVLLLLVAGLLAFPAAAGLGPFSPERSLSPDAPEEGLDDAAGALLPFARFTRAAALLMALVANVLPHALLGQYGGMLVVAGLAAAAGWALRRTPELPRLTLPAALRWCWWRALPLALAGLVYLIVI